MKLKQDRIGRDHAGNPILTELHSGTLRICVLNIIKILEDNPHHGITGYHSMTQLMSVVMWEYWRRYNGMPEHMTQERFYAWFVTQATFPDVIRRAIQWLRSQRLVDIDPAVEAAADANARALQGQFSGIR